MLEYNKDLEIVSVDVKDMRWPTSLGSHGSDAMHTDPDYSCAYVTITLARGVYGSGLSFTLGRGTDIVVYAVHSMKYLVEGRNVFHIYNDFGQFWREITSESQLRWVGPEKGVTHLAVAALVNALWDLWAKLENKPVWKLLTDMEPEILVSTIDFRYITDVITPAEAIAMCREMQKGKSERIKDLLENGYQAYTTQVGWMGYSDDIIKERCREYLDKGYTAFKLKVGRDLESDIKRCKLVRECIGWENKLMVDANQVWEVNEAIEWMQSLVQFKPMWIEEPTSPDDVVGHAKIARALEKYNIAVATGEMCANRIMFKQLLQLNSIEYCQIDSCRIGGLNEILSVYFMAKKMNVKVVPHAGGVGLCEMVQHLQMWDYTSLSGTKEGRMIEFVDQQHEQFINPTNVINGFYMPPTAPGYSTELKNSAIHEFEYPSGSQWQKLFNDKIFPRPK